MKSWESFKSSAEKAESIGKLEHAESYWYAALEQAEVEFPLTDPRTTSTLEHLAEILFRQSKYAQALPVVIKTMEVFEDSLGPTHSDIGILCNNLAMLYHLQGNYGEAEKLYKRSMEIQTKTLGNNHPEVANLLANYSDLMVRTHRQAEADQMRAHIQGMTTGRWTRSLSHQAYRQPEQGQPADLQLEYQVKASESKLKQISRENQQPAVAAGLPPGIARIVQSRRQQQDQ